MTLYRITDHWWLDQTFRSRKFIACQYLASWTTPTSCGVQKRESYVGPHASNQLLTYQNTAILARFFGQCFLEHQRTTDGPWSILGAENAEFDGQVEWHLKTMYYHALMSLTAFRWPTLNSKVSGSNTTLSRQIRFAMSESRKTHQNLCFKGRFGIV